MLQSSGYDQRTRRSPGGDGSSDRIREARRAAVMRGDVDTAELYDYLMLRTERHPRAGSDALIMVAVLVLAMIAILAVVVTI